MPLFPMIDRPHNIQPKSTLDNLSVDDLKDLYWMKTTYGDKQRDILCQHIDDAEDRLTDCDSFYLPEIQFYKDKIDKLYDMLKDPRCHNPSAILHNINVNKAELDSYQQRYDKKYPVLKAEYDKCVATLEFFDKYEAYTANEIWTYAAKKFRKDVSRGIPNPGALQDPLYRGIVTDDLDDPYYEPNGG